MFTRARMMSALLGLATLVAVTGCASQRRAMEYQILVERPGAAAQHVPETTSYASGEKFRLGIKAEEDGYIYVFNQGTTGTWNILLPDPRIRNGNAFVRGGHEIIIPQRGRGAFQFDANAGVETVWMCLSPQAVPALDAFVYGSGADGAELEAVIQQIEADSLHDEGQVKKTHDEDHTRVVLKSQHPDAVLVNRMSLAHRPLGY